MHTEPHFTPELLFITQRQILSCSVFVYAFVFTALFPILPLFGVPFRWPWCIAKA